MNDIEKQEIERIKNKLNLHGEHKDLEMLRIMERLFDGYNEVEHILDQRKKSKTSKNIFGRIKKKIYKRI